VASALVSPSGVKVTAGTEHAHAAAASAGPTIESLSQRDRTTITLATL
jgi:hypothetical protein